MALRFTVDGLTLCCLIVGHSFARKLEAPVRLKRLLLTGLFLLAPLAIGAGMAVLSFDLAFHWRMERDARLFPHDGQSGLDVLAFAFYVAAFCAIVSAWLAHRLIRMRK
ncbi:hypothetical protein [Novosphingobium humi]|uniref:hypothetical protein n=1 Tax=Novosphingobium humi TaxID=2282397 RepID=UPI0025B0C0AA|nr:hypothetical protein [Novosphingobium humi]WJS98183.1 hypothetical protein NYQ05_13770 [Novosphingobium humi]